MPVPTWLPTAVSGLGIAIEAAGVWIFTVDVLEANGGLIEELRQTRKRLSVRMRTIRITISDGPGGGVDLGDAEISENIDPQKLPAALTQRRKLRVGAGL
jgi:hypothetical protein